MSKFYSITQNNSGGVFDNDPEKGIGYAICVEAHDASHAKSRLQDVIDSYFASSDCPCCGRRWSVWLDDDDGTIEPELYDRPLKGAWGIPSYIHYLDGRIVEVQP